MNKRFYLWILWVGLFTTACTSEEPLPDNVEQQPDDAAFVTLEGDFGVTEENIGNIVKAMKGKDSRSTDYTVSTIVDSLGQPTIYVVNFKNNGGFLLVSATKSHYPILAYNDEGNYNVNSLNPSAKFWQGKMVEDVTASFDMPEDSIAKNVLRWSFFNDIHKRESRWLSPDEYPDHWTDDVIDIYNNTRKAIMDSTAKWIHKYPMAIFSDGILDRSELGGLTTVEQEQALNEAIEACKNHTWYWIEDQWQDVSVIVIRTNRTVTQNIPNFVRSTWDQENGYNKYFPAYMSGPHYAAGCATVAIGQIMYHHRWPSNYNWDAMDPNQATDESALFLKDIVDSSENVEYNYRSGIPGISIYDISNMILEKGYYTRSCDGIVCSNYLEQGWPIYIRGVNSDSDDGGHAWICSGAYSYYEYTYLEAYTLTYEKELQKVYSYMLDYNSYNSLYMNWGWGGKDNGFYSVGKPFTPLGHYYNSDFKTLLVHPIK